MNEDKKPSEVAEKSSTKQRTASSRDTGTYIYIGPNILPKGLKRYTVYQQRPVDLIAQAAEAYKNIGRLFVRVEDLNTAMVSLETKGTPINLAMKEVKGE